MAISWGPRVLTGFTCIPTALWLLSYDCGMVLLAMTLCCLSLAEFNYIICSQIVPQLKLAREGLTHGILIVASGAVVCAGAWTGSKLTYDALSLTVTLIIFSFHLTSARKIDQTALLKLLLDLFALFYIVNGFGYAILLRYSSSKYGLGLQILGLSCAWIGDTGALLAGSYWGNTKLAPLVSPGKTVTGAIVGVMSTTVTVLVMFALPRLALTKGGHWTHELLPPLDVVPLSHQIMLGVVLGALCIVGDLVESYLKRVAGVKDSGTFFPGHGGCLDRMDSFLFVAPCLYFYSQFAF